MKKIVVTGSGSFLGTRFCRCFQDKYTIIPFTRQQLDVCSGQQVLDTIRDCRPDLIFHLAALTSTEYCNAHREDTEAINVGGTEHIIAAAEAVNAKILFAGSEQVFNGNQNAGPYSEQDTPVPNTAYGESKLKAEKLLDASVVPHWTLRFTWLFGTPEHQLKINSNILWSAVSAAMQNKPIHANTNEFRGYTYCYDLIKAIENVFDLPYGTYNLGSTTELSRYDFLRVVFELCGMSGRFNDIVVPEERAVRDLRIDMHKIKSCGIDLGSSEQAIERCIRQDLPLL